jgi:hypothetical protein
MTATFHKLNEYRGQGWYPWKKVLHAANSALDVLMSERAKKCEILQGLPSLMEVNIEGMVREHRQMDKAELLHLMSCVASAAAAVGDDPYASVSVSALHFDLIKKHYNQEPE